MHGFLKLCLDKLIFCYQFLLSPFIGNQCRFSPTCSVYARQAIKRHGVLKGIVLASRRVGCCHPYYNGNYHDEVPETFEWRDLFRYKQATQKTCCHKEPK